MESARRQRDKTYRHLFKGSVLVSTLLEQDKERFSSRAEAIRFGQHLLDNGHIQSIVGSKEFDDSVHLYRWTDESIVEEAKRLVSSTSNQSRRERLIETVDFQKEGSWRKAKLIERTGRTDESRPGSSSPDRGQIQVHRVQQNDRELRDKELPEAQKSVSRSESTLGPLTLGLTVQRNGNKVRNSRDRIPAKRCRSLLNSFLWATTKDRVHLRVLSSVPRRWVARRTFEEGHFPG